MEPEWYEIQVRGHMSAAWSDWFGGMEVTNLDSGEAIICGPLPDQAALHGVLARIHSLNLTLLGLRRVGIAEPRIRQNAAEERQGRISA